MRRVDGPCGRHAAATGTLAVAGAAASHLHMAFQVELRLPLARRRAVIRLPPLDTFAAAAVAARRRLLLLRFLLCLLAATLCTPLQARGFAFRSHVRRVAFALACCCPLPTILKLSSRSRNREAEQPLGASAWRGD